MRISESFQQLLRVDQESAWADALFDFGSGLGFDRCLVAIVPKPGMGLDQAYLRSNYPGDWRSFYDAEGLVHVDPTVAHCVAHSTSLIWSPGLFRSSKQQVMYEEASGYGLKSGITLPMHGPWGELGILCFVNDAKPSKRFDRDVSHVLPELSLLRDMAFQSGVDFALMSVAPEAVSVPAPLPKLTAREMACLQWIKEGKTSWETGRILGISESTVNFHVASFNRKLDAPNRHQAVIKALKLGLL